MNAPGNRFTKFLLIKTQNWGWGTSLLLLNPFSKEGLARRTRRLEVQKGGKLPMAKLVTPGRIQSFTVGCPKGE